MADKLQIDTSICIIAGEPSGDLLAASLVQDLRRHLPQAAIWGMTGMAMREAGVETIYPMERQSVMGFTQVLRHLPTVLQALREVCHRILERRPVLVVLVDYPGFNLRLAKRLRKAGYTGRIVQMVSPSVWAHSPGRIQAMAQTLDMLLTIFPFEADYFRGSGLITHYIGNPVAERVREGSQHPPALLEQMAQQHRLVGLFPGSRKQDLDMHLPTLLSAGRELLRRYPDVRLVLSCAHERLPALLHSLRTPGDGLSLGETLLLVDQHHNLGMMGCLTAAIAKSGTMTLELALKGVPTVCCYGISLFNALIVKLVLRVKLPYYCIVNLLRQREVFPERVFRQFTTGQVVEALEPFLMRSPQRSACLQELEELQQELAYPPHPSQRAAQILLELLGHLPKEQGGL
jgi:lipid-A-disaccharide synthase